MDAATHQLDREAMLADRRAAADRVRREVDGVVAAAAAKRRAFLDHVVDRLRLEARLRAERERIVRAGQGRGAPAFGNVDASPVRARATTSAAADAMADPSRDDARAEIAAA